MPKKTPVYCFGLNLANAAVWFTALVLLGISPMGRAQNLSGTLGSGESDPNTLSNCATLTPSLMGCNSAALSPSANVVLQSGGQIVLGPGVRFAASNTSSLTALIGPPLYITNATTPPISLPSGNAQAFYSYTFTAAGGFPPYSFGWTSSPPNNNLTLSLGGVLSGTPSGAASYAPLSIRVIDATGAQAFGSFNLTINGPLAGPTVSCSGAQSGQTVSFSASISGGSGFYTYSWSGSVSGSGSMVQFSPSIGGNYSESLIVKDTSTNGTSAAHCSATAQLTGGSAPPITATPSSQIVGPTSTASYSITINPIAGFSGPVNLSASGLPDGAVASFNPSISSSGTTTLTITTAATSPTGSFPIAVTALGGSHLFTAYVVHTVGQPSPANLLTPPPGGVITSGNVAFNWDAGVGVTSYQLSIGSTPGASDIYAGSPTSQLSATVFLSAATPMYVTLSSLCGGVWENNPPYPFPPPIPPPTGSLPQGGNALATYSVPNDGSKVTFPFCLSTSANGPCGSAFPSNSIQLCNVRDSSGINLINSVTATPNTSDPNYAAAIDVTFSAAQTPPGSYELNCLFSGEPVDWAITVYDGPPVITYVQQYPSNPDGSFYMTLWGHNFGPGSASGSVEVCLQGADPCQGGTSVTVCLSAGCGNAFHTWTDGQVNALVIPSAPDTPTFYDVVLIALGEAGGGIFYSLRSHAVSPSPATPTVRIYQGATDITGQTQTVIVGQQIALSGIATVGTPLNFGWTVNGGRYVGGFSASLNQGCTVDVNAEDPAACATTVSTSGQNLTIWFTPPVPAGTVTVTYRVSGGGGSAMASTTFNVVAPALQFSPPFLAVGSGPGNVAYDNNSNKGPNFVAFHYGNTNNDLAPAPGIKFADVAPNGTSNPIIPPGYPNTTLKWIQIVNSAFYSATNTAGNSLLTVTCAGGVDDAHVPSPQSYVYSFGQTTIDSPAQPLTAAPPVIALATVESFEMFLMFDPNMIGSIAVPIAVIPWTWSGQAISYDGGNTFNLYAPTVSALPSGGSNGQTNGIFPTWLHPCVPQGQ